MKRYLVAFMLAAMAAIAVPSIASAHWVARQTFSNSQWWAIHYNMYRYATGVEFFASLGGAYALPYRVEVYNASTGVALCGTGYIQPNFGQHYTMFCNNQFANIGASNGTHDFRCRILTPYYPYIGPPGWYTSGYYCRDLLAPGVPVA